MKRGNTGSCVNDPRTSFYYYLFKLVLIISSFRRVHVSSSSHFKSFLRSDSQHSFRDRSKRVVVDSTLLKTNAFWAWHLARRRFDASIQKSKSCSFNWDSWRFSLLGWFRKTWRWVATVRSVTKFDSEAANPGNSFCL